MSIRKFSTRNLFFNFFAQGLQQQEGGQVELPPQQTPFAPPARCPSTGPPNLVHSQKLPKNGFDISPKYNFHLFQVKEETTDRLVRSRTLLLLHL